jgi:hypothetical protein
MANKRVELDDLLDEGRKIYVKNTSRPMGHIVLTFVTANGKSIPRAIPRTWIPVCLTDTLSPDIIRQSNDLRLFLTKGVINLVDPDEAQKALQSPEAQEELNRLNLSDFSNKAESTDRVLQMDSQQTFSSAINNPMATVDGMVEDPVNSRVKSNILRVESKDMTERDAVTDLRIMQDELTTHDLTYIISQVQDEGPLRRFAYQLLNQLSAAVDQDIVAETPDDPPEDPEALAAGKRAQELDKG